MNQIYPYYKVSQESKIGCSPSNFKRLIIEFAADILAYEEEMLAENQNETHAHRPHQYPHTEQ